MRKITIYERSGCNIIIADSIITTILLFWALSKYTAIHNGINLILSIIFFISFLCIYRTRIGFIILSLLYSGTIAVVAGALAHDATKGDWIWTIVIGFLALIICLVWHAVSLHDSGADFEGYIK